MGTIVYKARIELSLSLSEAFILIIWTLACPPLVQLLFIRNPSLEQPSGFERKTFTNQNLGLPAAEEQCGRRWRGGSVGCEQQKIRAMWAKQARRPCGLRGGVKKVLQCRLYCTPREDLASLMARLCDTDKAMEAFKLLSMIHVKDPSCKLHIYNKALDSLLSSGNITHALQLFEQMKAELPLNQSAYFSLWVSLCKAGHVEDACRQLDDMVPRGFVPETPLLNSLISDLCKAGKWNACHQVLFKLCELGHIPPLVIFNTFFSCLCQAGRMQHACKLLDDIIKLGFSLDVYTYSIMIHTLCKADKVNEAYKLLKAMRNKKCTPDVVCYSTVLHGFVRLGKQKLALKIVDEMHTHGCSPDVVTYNSLISMFSKQGETDKASDIWSQMRASGCEPDHISYTAMIDGLCRQNKARECLTMLMEMLKEKKLMPNAPLQRKFRECLERHGVDAEMHEILLEMKKLGLDFKVLKSTKFPCE